MTGSFLQKDPEDLELFLLQQARSDGAPRAALQRALISLTSVSLGVGLTGSAKLAWGASAAGKVTPWLITKCVAIGMTATLATFVGAERLHQAFGPSETSTGAPPARPDVVLGHPAHASSFTPSGPAALAEAPPARSTRAAAGAPSTAPTPLEADAPQSSHPSLPSSTAFDSATLAGDSAALAREVAQLRRARASLVASAPGAALQALDRYAREFPAGALRAEAAALRIEAVAMLGDRTLVRRLASDFLIRFPSSPLAERVRVVSGSAGEGESKP
jgi:hypothetical protein